MSFKVARENSSCSVCSVAWGCLYRWRNWSIMADDIVALPVTYIAQFLSCQVRDISCLLALAVLRFHWWTKRTNHRQMLLMDTLFVSLLDFKLTGAKFCPLHWLTCQDFKISARLEKYKLRRDLSLVTGCALQTFGPGTLFSSRHSSRSQVGNAKTLRG